MGHCLITLLTTASATAVVLVTMAWSPIPRVVWNASESVPVGLYRVYSTGRLMVSDLVVAIPPEPLATFLVEGGYLPRGVPLIKRILALSGQTVCRRGLIIFVDGIEMGTARERDRRGRWLPDWQGCRIIGGADIFLMNHDERASFDGRYFGSSPDRVGNFPYFAKICGVSSRHWTTHRPSLHDGC